MQDIFVIDIGGTKIESIYIFDNLTYKTDIMKTPNSENFHSDLEILIKFIIPKIRSNVTKITISFPGLIEEGIIKKWPNKPYWEGYDLKSSIHDYISNPVEIFEDSNMGAISNFYIFDNYENSIYINVGTGIGLGLLLNQQLYLGNNNYAGELGHTQVQSSKTINCSCGKINCLQLFSSGKGMLNRLLEIDKYYRRYKTLSEIPKYDQHLLVVLKEGGELLGITMSNLINIMDITNLHFGGSVINNPYYTNSLLNVLYENESKFLNRKLNIQLNVLRNPSLVGGILIASGYNHLPKYQQNPLKSIIKLINSRSKKI